MSERIGTDRQGDIAILSLRSAPANLVVPELVDALRQAFAAALAEDGVRAIVLGGDGRHFSAGSDLRDPDGPSGQGAAALTALCALIEGAGVPVIAALQGAVLGAGAELALAAHYRLGDQTVRFGFPEIALGLIPAAGGLQRLSRLAGAERAIDLGLSGRRMAGAEALEAGILDLVVAEDPRGAAVSFARQALVEGLGPRPSRGQRVGMEDPARWLAAVARSRAAVGCGETRGARLAVIDCVEAALLLPAEAAFVFEREAAARAAADPASKALCHLFRAERQAVPRFLQRDRGVAVPTDEGAQIVALMGASLESVAAALVRQGASPGQIDGLAVAQGFAAGPFGGTAPGMMDEALWRRLLAAVAADGARLIEAGLVEGAGVVDALAVLSAGWPRRSGGPMWAAQQAGLVSLVRDMGPWAEEDEVWRVPPLMRRAAVEHDGWDGAVATVRPRPSGPRPAGPG